AIYGFRGADVGTYLAACAEIRKHGGDEVVLADCYRATAALIEGYNRIFDQEVPRPFFQGKIRYDHPVGCGRPGLRRIGPEERPENPIHVFQVEEGADEVLEVLATRSAQEIRRLVRPEDPPVLWDEGRGPRPLGYGDIYVLYRYAAEG